MIATAALITAIATAVMGREAIVDANHYGMDMFSGTIYNFPEFRTYIGEMYNKAMIGYAGIGDDMGYPLTDSHAEKYALQAKEDFEDMVRVLNQDILYYIQGPGEETVNVQSNVTYPIFSEYDGHLLLPDDMLLCCYWDGESGTLRIFNRNSRIEDNYDALDWYYQAQYKPNREVAEDMKLILAVREDCTSPRLSQMAYKAAKYQTMMITFVASVITWLLFGCFSLFSGKAGRKAKEEFGVISGKVLLEIKLILIALSIWFLIYNKLFHFFEYLSLRLRIYDSLWLYFPLGCLIYLLYTDIKQNGVNIFLNSLPVKGVCGIVETVRKKPWYRRATAMSVSMLIGSVLLAVVGVYLISLYGNWYYYMGGRMQQTKEVLLVCGIVMILAGMILFFCYVGQKRLLKDTESIVSKLSDMKEGIENAPLQLSKYSLLTTAAKDLNELETGIERAVEQQNRSNKMRVELLTNVSHDLKTP
uniref:hypothetical protein n=1 Tax=Acetatifactor sp. TaxID=1872090 RepID=UPI00405715BD